MLELGPTECRSSEGLGVCYSLCLTAPSRSRWSGGSWWALGVCGSPKTRRLYTVWSSPFRRWRRSILSDHLLFGEARELYPCVGAPTWIRGERQLLDTTGKNPVVSCPLLLFQAIKSICCYSCFWLLVDWLRQLAGSVNSFLSFDLASVQPSRQNDNDSVFTYLRTFC